MFVSASPRRPSAIDLLHLRTALFKYMYIPWGKGEYREENTQTVPQVDIIFSGGIIPQQQQT